jgi:hypothetical protein
MELIKDKIELELFRSKILKREVNWDGFEGRALSYNPINEHYSWETTYVNQWDEKAISRLDKRVSEFNKESKYDIEILGYDDYENEEDKSWPATFFFKFLEK